MSTTHHPANPSRSSGLVIGLDVGSTTVKAVVVAPDTRAILWSDYRRHETKQVATAAQMLSEICEAFPTVTTDGMHIFITGSGGSPLVEPLGATFVQEVNAVTLAVEMLHPEAGSVIELGGQDAKIIIFQRDPKTGEKRPLCSMNDKCASGTGATIDKCILKAGLPREQLAGLRFDATKLHKVAAKCGVFAETDIVNLIKSGIPAPEVVCSLADAIVNQNLSVLTRGNTLLPQVILLGGPNTYLPFLQDCWRLRIPETWTQRGMRPPLTDSIEDVIVVPDNAQYYAAYGAVLYGLDLPEGTGRFRGMAALREFASSKESAASSRQSGARLVHSEREVREFRREYAVPKFERTTFVPGETVRAVIGLDGGSTSSKAVLVSQSGEVLAKSYRLSKGNPIEDFRNLLTDLNTQVEQQGAQLEVLGFGATGYAADVLETVAGADVNIVETVAHMLSARHFFGEIDVICDVGGQDIKVLMMQNGDISDFRLSNQCSAGNGMLLQAMADQFGVPLREYADTAFAAKGAPVFSYGCAVFLDSDRVNFQKEGYHREELLAGLAMVLPKNIWQYVVQIPRLASLGTRFVLQGGTQYNLAAVKAQVDYIKERVPGAEVHVHPYCGEAGAIGAAIEVLRVVKRKGGTSFIGMRQSMGIAYTTRNDEKTRCNFCRNHCSRTFVDAQAPDGRNSRYISGFSCEKGTVESKDAMLALVKKRNALKEEHLNLLEYEARVVFQSVYKPKTLPDEGSPLPAREVAKAWWPFSAKRNARSFQRSNTAAAERRQHLRIGIPRVLNLYTTAPLFRAYFEALGIPSRNICFSPPTSEEMYLEGARYGSVDPCYPSKVVQAHLHHLLFKAHQPPESSLDYIFFPSITHLPTFVSPVMDSASCPIVAGTPNVMKAAFTKEQHYFAARGTEYIDSAVTLEEPAYFKRQMFEMWGERLGITEDESDFAVDEGWEALRQINLELERRGLEVLEKAERENKIVLLVLARPYHADPGMNHGLLEEFQALGYPVLTIRSIPKEPAWLSRWFREDLESGRISNPLDIRDVWPENYSTNSVQKVWAAKFAARHPHVAVLDLSSFKCGHDAPTYGLISDIIAASKTPYLAMHDLDANKPAGSQKIRVKTYAYTLRRHQEMLEDRAARFDELQQRLAERRNQLMARRKETLERQYDVARADMDCAFHRYLEEEESVFGIRTADLSKEYPASPPQFDRTADIAPQPPRVDFLTRTAQSGASCRGGCSGCGTGCSPKPQLAPSLNFID
ncbi:putative CoA-substrate-specific enzyme activase [Roseimicrobium gellanilyticum]|uniref:Putative CoA-substrate-specific enzyme activase n=1 Tax=Roseimicrobium gellanilyticum TaxID=748857 RepID=A0A366HPD1_9BACT|nr:BadF/BadG/BcrA/BcrD ATPase family protein [Roseimicrobium gellanilyticum]RBP45370.1 putative CoA-substrate-specific enzyme activase [Roseimicrobium gellanilyticum]